MLVIGIAGTELTAQERDWLQHDACAGVILFSRNFASKAQVAELAAANPAENDYYYWVTVNLDTGETKFAKTYAEHQKNVEEYQSWCSDHEGKCS